MNDAEAILNMKKTVGNQINKVKEKEAEVSRLIKSLSNWWDGDTAEAFEASYSKLIRQLEYEYNLVNQLESNLSTLSSEVRRAIREEEAKRKVGK